MPASVAWYSEKYYFYIRSGISGEAENFRSPPSVSEERKYRDAFRCTTQSVIPQFRVVPRIVIHTMPSYFSR